MRALVRSSRLGQLSALAGAPAGIASALVAVALTSLLIAWIKSQVDIPNLAILYLLAVLGMGSVYGRAAALVAAAASFLTFNYFFIEPISTFHVANPQEWLALVVLLLTALVTGHLAA